jgi:hypothetical protein
METNLTNTELSVILQALGKEKAYLNSQGLRESAHAISELQAKIKNGE